MNQALNLDGLTRAARRREFDDGLMDFFVGAAFLFYGTLCWLVFSPWGMEWYVRALVKHRALTLFGLVILAVVFFAGPLGVRRAIERVRLSEAWRHRGFVKPLRRQASWPTLVLSAVVVVGMIVVAAWLMATGRIPPESVLRTLVASTGIGTGIVYFGMGLSLRLSRYLTVGVAGGILSMAILLVPASFSFAWLLLGTAWVAVLSASGAWALRQYLSAREDSAGG